MGSLQPVEVCYYCDVVHEWMLHNNWLQKISVPESSQELQITDVMGSLAGVKGPPVVVPLQLASHLRVSVSNSIVRSQWGICIDLPLC